jgi:hypothetical protein
MKLIPAASARSMMAMPSSAGVTPPKFIAPRHSEDTITPVRPKGRYSIIFLHINFQADAPILPRELQHGKNHSIAFLGDLGGLAVQYLFLLFFVVFERVCYTRTNEQDEPA